jgi:periplasmic protein TonB
MAYSDIDRGIIQPKGLALATVLNGSVLAFALLAGSTVAKLIKDPPLKVDWIIEPIQAPPPPAKDQLVEPKKLVIPKRETNKTGPVTRNDLTESVAEDSGGGEIDLGLSVKIPEDITPVPPPPNPVIRTARLDPRYASALQPDYPPSMIRAEMEGSVAIRVLVGVDGRVKDVQIVKAASADFAEATKRQALKKWRFLPATSDGQPIESWREMNVRFEIPD